MLTFATTKEVLTSIMKYSELKRELTKRGCFLLQQGKRHEIWKNPTNGHITTIGRHDKEEVKIKTLRSIYNDLFKD